MNGRRSQPTQRYQVVLNIDRRDGANFPGWDSDDDRCYGPIVSVFGAQSCTRVDLFLGSRQSAAHIFDSGTQPTQQRYPYVLYLPENGTGTMTEYKGIKVTWASFHDAVSNVEIAVTAFKTCDFRILRCQRSTCLAYKWPAGFNEQWPEHRKRASSSKDVMSRSCCSLLTTCGSRDFLKVRSSPALNLGS
jgi:hypothetical protein